MHTHSKNDDVRPGWDLFDTEPEDDDYEVNPLTRTQNSEAEVLSEDDDREVEL
jgi:hypothetical protein